LAAIVAVRAAWDKRNPRRRERLGYNEFERRFWALVASYALPAIAPGPIQALIPLYLVRGLGITQAEVDEMYQVMAIANYEDRFVIPSTHREYAENTFNVRGGCGFSFGNGCSEGVGETSLFGGEKRRTIPIKAEV